MDPIFCDSCGIELEANEVSLTIPRIPHYVGDDEIDRFCAQCHVELINKSRRIRPL